MSDSPRDKVRAILIDRWSLDEEDGWGEFGEDTLDDIDAAYKHELTKLTLLLDDLTDSDIGEVQARNQELWESNQALHAEVRRLGGGML